VSLALPAQREKTIRAALGAFKEKEKHLCTRIVLPDHYKNIYI
jgi:hypothetical protein